MPASPWAWCWASQWHSTQLSLQGGYTHVALPGCEHPWPHAEVLQVGSSPHPRLSVPPPS